MRRIVLVVGLVIFAGVALIGFWLFYALNGMASLLAGWMRACLWDFDGWEMRDMGDAGQTK
jgi:hypothetical protein